MTRDEAVDAIFRFAPGTPSRPQAENWITAFIALGMLKLDEPPPKTLYGKISDAQAKFTDHTPPADVRLAFNRVGLDIVEIVEK